MKNCAKHDRTQITAAKEDLTHIRNGKQTLMLKLRRVAAALVIAVAFGVVGLRTDPVTFAGNGSKRWVGTWSAALHAPNAGPPGLTNPG
ncbi:MAG TPA: hypothetical protein VFQ92_18460, partial [Blastocatellia bacterium]|nr:hypothetical protein [Blastocatellia bacterium]